MANVTLMACNILRLLVEDNMFWQLYTNNALVRENPKRYA